ncbi:MAG: Ribosome-recycling factor [Bacteroidetes bacterium ADurb.Bin397]|jgi:ribosome recycling factor|nr:ribosome recycling factor [Bacteroidia bacterium]OQA12334.1 MAG: Ribosome-recycling factor [Bacteroidetes bacterium ADurb.Bin397]
MTEEIKKLISDMESHMEKAISHLEAELAKIRAGKANPSMLDGLHVDYYGNSTPMSQVANINTPDARTIIIQPWEKGMLIPIEKAIQAANLGFNPQNDGVIIRITVPPLTEERRKDLVKKTKAEGEAAKVSVRNLRRDANETVKKEVKKGGLPEDITKDAESKIQNLTDSYIAKIDKHLDYKEKEIMTV